MKKGNWRYDNMIVQLKDCIDVLHATNANTYNYLFLFDNSYGHDMVSEDRLNVDKMNVGMG